MALNATVHHEMLAPLKANAEASKYLSEFLKDEKDRELAQATHISDRLLLNHMQDLLDHSVISNDGFKPDFVSGSILNSINEVVLMMRQVVKEQQIEIKVKDNFVGFDLDQMVFDERRFQQVLVNVLLNAIEQQCYGSIRINTSISIAEGDLFVCVLVQDQSIGLTPEQLNDLLEDLNS